MKTQLIACLILCVAPFFLTAQINGYNPVAVNNADKTIAAFKDKDAKFHAFFQ